MNFKPLVLLLIVVNLATAQQLNENVFPLNIDNVWMYRYQYYYSWSNNEFDGSIQNDSGIVIYKIVDSTKFADSVKWKVQTIQNLITKYSEYTFDVKTLDTTYNSIDTSSFDLWQQSNGKHQLFVDNVYDSGNPIWKFMSFYPDSEEIFQYQSTDSLHKAIFHSNSSFGYIGSLSVPINIAFVKDSGVVALSVSSYGLYHPTSLLTIQCTLFSSKLITSVFDESNIKKSSADFSLYQNYPNPFNPTTTITYDLPKGMFVSLVVYDLLGRKVKTLVRGFNNAGHNAVQFDASPLSSGVYFYQLTSGGFILTKPLILLK
jgi:Secretion system C-terminal sorting domain